MKKIDKGHYQTENGFEIIKYSEGWVISHQDSSVLEAYLNEGYDQIFVSLSDAKAYVSDI